MLSHPTPTVTHTHPSTAQYNFASHHAISKCYTWNICALQLIILKGDDKRQTKSAVNFSHQLKCLQQSAHHTAHQREALTTGITQVHSLSPFLHPSLYLEKTGKALVIVVCCLPFCSYLLCQIHMRSQHIPEQFPT